MTDVLITPSPRILRRGTARGRTSLRADRLSHPHGADLAAPGAHLAERAYAAELAHAERAHSHWRSAPERSQLQFEARP
jgi:hypothetical protein